MSGRSRIGIDLGGTKIASLVLGPEDEVLHEQRVATPQGDYRKTIQAIHDLVTDAARACGGDPSVGLALPGSLSPKTGLVQNANSTWLNGTAFLRDLEQALGLRVRAANDANCLALSEFHDGAAKGADSVFAVILGTGVGGGLMAGGRLVAGRHAIGGEWGHVPLPWPRGHENPGPRCWCGNRGCLETWLSGPALSRDHELACGRSIPGEEIAGLAQSGDAGAQAALARHAERLARGLAMIVNIFDPEIIVLGGGLGTMDRLPGALGPLMRPYIFADHFETPVRRARHGDASGVRGAARLWPREGPP